jgi:hypothetical protein
MIYHTNKLLKGLRPSEAVRVEEIYSAEFRSEMLAQITGEDREVAVVRRARPDRPRRPLLLGALGATTLLACAALAAVLATGSAVSPAPADAVSFHTSANGDLLASIADPFATRTRLNAAFAKQGLHITVRLIPASPSTVGRVLYMSLSSSRGPQIEPLREGQHCTSGDADCAIGLRIPRGFTATATIGLGRPARPGETYASSGSAFAPGELLHCSGLLGATVAQGLPALERHKFTIQWMQDIEVAMLHSGTSSRARTVADPPANYYIWGATLSSHGHIVVQIEPKPWPATPGAGAGLNDGC